jgi:mannose-1-phosphate guanylyltransferase
MKLVILAGGSGSRLWPLSRKNTPKQLQVILGDLTLLQKTYQRLRQEFSQNDIYIATGQDQAESIISQIPELLPSHLILEPMRRDTAAAIGLAAITIAKDFPNEVMININSDHFIKDEAKYLRAIHLVEKIISENSEHGVLIGVKPTYPETGYGYIKMGEELSDFGEFKVFNLDSFKEKPDLETAKIYFSEWEYLWNIGCFAWRVDVLLALFENHLPEMSQHLLAIQAAIGGEKYQETLSSEFSAINPISMDYGIVEKTNKLLVIPADFGWADIGHWKTVKDVLSEAETDNVTKGQVLTVDSKNNLAYSYTGKLIALVGVDDLVVVENGDTILVCTKERAQDVKKITDKLKEQGLEQFL